MGRTTKSGRLVEHPHGPGPMTDHDAPTARRHMVGRQEPHSIWCSIEIQQQPTVYFLLQASAEEQDELTTEFGVSAEDVNQVAWAFNLLVPSPC